MPVARHGRSRTASQGGDESSSEESDSGRRTPSPSQHRKFLRSYASSSSLPVVNGLDAVEDEGELGPLVPNPRGRSSTNHNLNPSSSSRRFIARPMQRRSSSNETISPRHYPGHSNSSPALPMFQSNRRLSRDEPPARPFLPATSHSTLPRFSVGTNGVASAGPSYIPRTPNGAPFASHHASSSAHLPTHSPPPYDIACVNGPSQGFAVRRSSIADLPSSGPNGFSTAQHELSMSPERDAHAEDPYAARVSRRRNGKGRSIDSLTDDAFSSSSPPPQAHSSSVRNDRTRLPQFPSDWRNRETGEPLSGETETETDDAVWAHTLIQ
jgi:hypothetical protein